MIFDVCVCWIVSPVGLIGMIAGIKTLLSKINNGSICMESNKIKQTYSRDVLTLDSCLAVGGWFSSDGPVTLESCLHVEVLVPSVPHIVDPDLL